MLRLPEALCVPNGATCTAYNLMNKLLSKVYINRLESIICTFTGSEQIVCYYENDHFISAKSEPLLSDTVAKLKKLFVANCAVDPQQLLSINITYSDICNGIDKDERRMMSNLLEFNMKSSGDAVQSPIY